MKENEMCCMKCRYFDHYWVDCIKKHSPNPPYNEWFCADFKSKKETDESKNK